MSYETSYDVGFKPFNHDKLRGKWARPMDFLFVCIGHAIKADSILFLPLKTFRELGFYAIIPYILIMGISSVPIIFMQSFLGQFSGTGFVSVFRITPLFKGIGYASLALNLITLTYYSIFSSVQLFQLAYTLQPTIPWSCEGAKEWMQLEGNMTSICSRNETIQHHPHNISIPSIEFFRTHVDPELRNEKIQFSWLLMACTIAVWVMVLIVCLKPVEKIGRLMRYSFFVVVGIMSLILLRCLFLPNALTGLGEFFDPYNLRSYDAWFSLPWIALGTLGPGWGTILSMASFNNFKTNIFSFSWIMSFAQLGIMLGLVFISMLMWGFMLQADELLDVVVVTFWNDYFNELLIIPTGLTLLELPHFWSIIFFVMQLLGSLTLLIVQLLSFLTSVFDEFESLRERKRDITMGLVGALALFSIYFCSNHGYDFMEFLAKSSLMTQMLINLLLILVVLWIYGRERFQRDVEFMTSRIYSTFMINIVRFVTPLTLLLGMLAGIFLEWEHGRVRNYGAFMLILGKSFTLLPWCLIPGYCIFRLLQTSGAVGQRFRRCTKPTDWYPGDPLYKQRYEETFSNPEVNHQLTMVPE